MSFFCWLHSSISSSATDSEVLTRICSEMDHLQSARHIIHRNGSITALRKQIKTHIHNYVTGSEKSNIFADSIKIEILASTCTCIMPELQVCSL